MATVISISHVSLSSGAQQLLAVVTEQLQSLFYFWAILIGCISSFSLGCAAIFHDRTQFFSLERSRFLRVVAPNARPSFQAVSWKVASSESSSSIVSSAVGKTQSTISRRQKACIGFFYAILFSGARFARETSSSCAFRRSDDRPENGGVDNFSYLRLPLVRSLCLACKPDISI